MDFDEVQNQAQLALESWNKGDKDQSAEHMTQAVTGMAAAGMLTRDNCEEKLLAYLQQPTVNVFACMNGVIRATVDHWSGTRGEAVKSGLPNQAP